VAFTKIKIKKAIRNISDTLQTIQIISEYSMIRYVKVMSSMDWLLSRKSGKNT